LEKSDNTTNSGSSSIIVEENNEKDKLTGDSQQASLKPLAD